MIGKPRVTSSLQEVANVCDHPSTSRQGDTLTVSNISVRLPSSSRDAELVDAANVNSSHEAVQSEGQKNIMNENTTQIATDATQTEMGNQDAQIASIESSPLNLKVNEGLPTSSAASLQDIHPEPTTKEDQNSVNNVMNVVLYREEVVAQLQADLDKRSIGEAVVDAQNTQGIDLPSDQPSLSQQQDPNVTESTISAADTTCAAALNNSCEALASTCIGPNNINVVTIDQHVHEKAGSMEEKDDVENGGDNQLLESSRKASPHQIKKPETEFKGIASVEKPQDKHVSQSISSDVETEEEVNSDEMPLSKIRARVHKSGVIHISDMPGELVAPMRTSVPELQQAFPGGQSFMDAGSINRNVASDAYKDNVLNSKLRKLKRGRRASSVDTAESLTNV